jgi:hypothetical protein
MQVQVNVKTAAKRVKQFIEAAGGETTHSEILELIAEVGGFDSYRALQAASTKAPKAVAQVPELGESTSLDAGVRLLENPASVVFSATAQDWQLDGKQAVSVDEVPAENRTKYDFIVEQDGSQFRVLMKPEGVHLDNFEGRAVLDMLVEINEGLPCVHMTNDPADVMLVTVFATGEGLLVREDGGEWMRADDHGAPDNLVALAEETCRGSELSEVHLAVLDTADKYSESEKPTESDPSPTQVSSAPTPAVRVFPHARTNLVLPVARKHVGSYVTVEFEHSKTEPAMLNAWVKLFDEDGVCGDEDAVLVLTRLSTITIDMRFRKFADNVAQLTAFFIEGGFDMGDLSNILQGIAADDDGPHRAERMVDEAQKAADRNEAYELVTALVVG